ncbi:hypothetical protein A33M_4195 [Rhodovulum sp. PH10]|nr:hypothetical protein A33M_4195 [Rhodovulum sp. PH10]
MHRLGFISGHVTRATRWWYRTRSSRGSPARPEPRHRPLFARKPEGWPFRRARIRHERESPDGHAGNDIFMHISHTSHASLRSGFLFRSIPQRAPGGSVPKTPNPAKSSTEGGRSRSDTPRHRTPRLSAGRARAALRQLEPQLLRWGRPWRRADPFVIRTPC